jgi:hypothetical protein
MSRQLMSRGAVILILLVLGVGLWLWLRPNSAPDRAADPAPDSAPPAPLWSDVVRFDFDSNQNPLTKAQGAASTRVDVDLVRSNGGDVVFGPSYDGADQALNFPGFAGFATGPRAVVAVAPRQPTDELSPGKAAFAFGADIRLVDPNEGSEFDNGNNIIQRGLFDTQAQFKLQIDKAVASCRVEGDAGSLTVKSSVKLDTGSWYGLRCERLLITGQEEVELLRITVTAFSDGTVKGESVQDTKEGQIGGLVMKAGVPLSIGGKLDRFQRIEEYSDQFNGGLDNVFFAVS